MKALYGSYPQPYESKEMRNGYHVAARPGPDNIDLILHGFQGMEPSRGPGGRTHPAAPYTTASPQQHKPHYYQPSAGVPTNTKYPVYSHHDPGHHTQQWDPIQEQGVTYVPVQGRRAPSAGQPGDNQLAAGGYRQSRPGEIPRAGRGLFADSSMHDHVRESFKEPPGDARAPLMTGRGGGAPGAVARNQDSLEAFMGGLAAGHVGNRDKELACDNFYGRAHAGKATISHLSSTVNGLQGPTAPLDNMPHISSTRAGHTSHLESNPDGGYIPQDSAANKVSSGLRVFTGQPQAQDHLQMSPTGLTAHGPVGSGGKSMVITSSAKNTSIGMSNVGLSHNGEEGGYPSINKGVWATKKVMSHLTQADAGLVESGAEPRRHNPFAGKNAYSQLTINDGALGGPDNQRVWANPHAGKGQVSQITYNSGTMTVVPQMSGPQLRKPAAGDGQWSTTYDSNYRDIYTTLQASKEMAGRRHQEAHTQIRF